MDSKNMAVLVNIIGGVESGGQVYGERNYKAYAALYTNSSKEYTVTLGWAQYYGDEAYKLISMIYAMDSSMQGQAWYDCFVDWCFTKAFGRSKANEIECGGCGIYYTPTSAQKYKNAGRYDKTPKVGDQIFFKNSSRICHTGIVYKVTSSKVYTIEGNTSGASGMISNGGGVCKKSYDRTNSRIAGYGHPKYTASGSAASSKTSATTTSASNLNETQKWVGEVTADSLNVRSWAGKENSAIKNGLSFQKEIVSGYAIRSRHRTVLIGIIS